jgi:hypothetical protein
MTLHRTAVFYTEWFKICLNVISKFHNIAVFKSAINHHNYSNKIYTYVHYVLVYQTSCFCKCSGSWVGTIKQRMNSNFRPPSMSVFLVFNKYGLIKSYVSFEDVSEHKISWSHVAWCKFCIHRKSSNFGCFGVVEGAGLKVRRRSHLQ